MTRKSSTPGTDWDRGEGTDSRFDALLRDVARITPVVPRRKQARLAPGTELLDARFIVRRLLGEGGMGVVYEVADRMRDTRVALKTLGQMDAAGISMLKREFRVLADVVHPNLVRYDELFSDGEQWFFSMELVPGVDFLAHVAGGGAEGIFFDEGRLREALIQLAEGVNAIHEAGKLHRDLKPSNVKVCPDSRVVLLDFGLASVRGGAGTGTGTSGTPEYMAPEQLDGKELNEAADWYAVGMMLYEALTGQPAHQRSADRSGDVTRPSSVAPGVPDDLEELCLSLIEPEPSARPDYGKLVRRLAGSQADISMSVAHVEFQEYFIGRHTELMQLENALADVGPGAPIQAHLHGPSGIGKTALLTRFLEPLQQKEDHLVLSGRCYEREHVPFKALDQVIDRLTRYLLERPSVEVELLLPPDMEILARLFPILRLVPGVSERGSATQPMQDMQEIRARAFGALRSLLVHVAERYRLVVTIEDLQWGDVDSMRLLANLFGSYKPPGLLLIVTYRTEELETSPALGALQSEQALASSREVKVGPLLGPEERELIDVLLDRKEEPARSHLEQILEQAEGNPFLLCEMVRYVMQTGDLTSADLRGALRRRVDLLEDEPRRLLELTCLAAKPLSQEVILWTAGDAGLGSTIRQLKAQKLVRTRGTNPSDIMEPYHDRIREVVVAGIGERQARLYHRQLAERIKQEAEPDLDALAEHYAGAGDLLRAVSYSEKAAKQAEESLAFEHAVVLYERLLSLLPEEDDRRSQVEYDLGVAMYWAGRLKESSEHLLRAAISLKRELPKLPNDVSGNVLSVSLFGRYLLLGRLSSTLGEVLYQMGRWKEAEEKMLGAEEVLRMLGRTTEAAIARSTRGFQFRHRGQVKEGLELARSAWETIKDSDNLPAIARVGHDLGNLLRDVGEPAESVEVFGYAMEAGEQALPRGLSDAEKWGRLAALSGRAMTYAAMGRYDEAIDDQRLAVKRSESYRDRVAVTIACYHLACHLADRRAPGDLKDAEQVVNRALSLSVEQNMFVRVVKCHLLISRIAVFRGEHDTARTSLDKAEALALETGMPRKQWLELLEQAQSND
ncbi:MAG: protein kinase [Deltaproteobacteria bacterium]|nr:protein kinase [Deltaproteobacteria bacterium]